jgi:hypothetical protein
LWPYSHHIVEIRTPYRAEYGQRKIFASTLVNEYQISIPMNAPKLQSNVEDMPPSMVSFASNNNYKMETGNTQRIVSKRDKNLWVPASLYWQERDAINLPYLPYFSNCKGYGSFIPLWALTEQHNDCELIPVEQVVYMHEYSFGKAPIADN